MSRYHFSVNNMDGNTTKVKFPLSVYDSGIQFENNITILMSVSPSINFSPVNEDLSPLKERIR